jgi:Uma2 family endonuclease
MATATISPELETTKLEGPILPERRRFTVAEFERMADQGIFRENERLELIDGEIIRMSKIKSPHAGCVSWLDRELNVRPTHRASVRCQSPIQLDDHTEPEPDIAIAKWREDDYRSAHPAPSDLLLVIEVMDTSATYDREVKLPIYSKAGIPEVWLVDLNERFIEVHRRPLAGSYADKTVAMLGQSVSPLAFPEVELLVDRILWRVVA